MSHHEQLQLEDQILSDVQSKDLPSSVGPNFGQQTESSGASHEDEDGDDGVEEAESEVSFDEEAELALLAGQL